MSLLITVLRPLFFDRVCYWQGTSGDEWCRRRCRRRPSEQSSLQGNARLSTRRLTGASESSSGKCRQCRSTKNSFNWSQHSEIS